MPSVRENCGLRVTIRQTTADGKSRRLGCPPNKALLLTGHANDGPSRVEAAPVRVTRAVPRWHSKKRQVVKGSGFLR
jgi:hypothetical protein